MSKTTVFAVIDIDNNKLKEFTKTLGERVYDIKDYINNNIHKIIQETNPTITIIDVRNKNTV